MFCLVEWDGETTRSVVPLKTVLGGDLSSKGERRQVRWNRRVYWGKCIGTGMVFWTKQLCVYIYSIKACTCTCPLGTKMEMESLLVSLEEAEEEQLSSPPTEQLPPPANFPLRPNNYYPHHRNGVRMHFLSLRDTCD